MRNAWIIVAGIVVLLGVVYCARGTTTDPDPLNDDVRDDEVAGNGSMLTGSGARSQDAESLANRNSQKGLPTPVWITARFRAADGRSSVRGKLVWLAPINSRGIPNLAKSLRIGSTGPSGGLSVDVAVRGRYLLILEDWDHLPLSKHITIGVDALHLGEIRLKRGLSLSVRITNGGQFDARIGMLVGPGPPDNHTWGDLPLATWTDGALRHGERRLSPAYDETEMLVHGLRPGNVVLRAEPDTFNLSQNERAERTVAVPQASPIAWDLNLAEVFVEFDPETQGHRWQPHVMLHRNQTALPLSFPDEETSDLPSSATLWLEPGVPIRLVATWHTGHQATRHVAVGNAGSRVAVHFGKPPPTAQDVWVRVRDARDRDMGSAEIEAVPLEVPSLGSTFTNHDTSWSLDSDDEGWFRLRYLVPGRYRIKMRVEQAAGFNDGYLLPVTKIVEVAQGKGIRVELRARVGGHPYLEVRDKSGKSISGLLRLFDNDNRRVPIQVLSEWHPRQNRYTHTHASEFRAGDFELRDPLASGFYRIEASHDGKQWSEETFTIQAMQDIAVTIILPNTSQDPK